MKKVLQSALYSSLVLVTLASPIIASADEVKIDSVKNDKVEQVTKTKKAKKPKKSKKTKQTEIKIESSKEDEKDTIKIESTKSTQQPDTSIKNLEIKSNEKKSKVDEEKEKLQNHKTKAKELKTRLAEGEKLSYDEAKSSLNDVNELASTVTEQVTSIEKELNQVKESKDARKDKLGEIARSQQVTEKQSGLINALLNGESVSDMITNLVGTQTIATAQDEVIEDLANQEKTMNDLQSEYDTLKGELEELKGIAEVLEADLEAEEIAQREAQDAASRREAQQAEERSQQAREQLSAPAERTVAAKPKAAPAANPATGNAIVDEAYKHIGKPYVWGAKGPDSFDCSGFTRYVYLQVQGRDIGTWTVPQESAGTVIGINEAQPGDLLFWGGMGGTHHVAIALGGGKYIHAPTFGQPVTVGSYQWYAPSFALRM